MDFNEYVKDFSEDKVENDFENIVLQFIENEREGKPLNWNTSRPFVSKDKNGKPTGNGFIKYIPLENFKEKLTGDLSNPHLNHGEIIAYYRNIFIEKALKIDNVNDLYKKLINHPDTVQSAKSQSRYSYTYTKLAVIELIRFEDYLNELKNKPQKTKEPELSLKQIALLYIYKGEFMPQDAADNIAKEYGYTSGQKLYQHYSDYRIDTDRKPSEKKRKDKSLMKDIEKIIAHLPEDKKATPRKEVELLKNAVENNY